VINCKVNPQITPLHPNKGLIKINMKKKTSNMVKSKRRAIIKEEIRMMGIMEKHNHIQEYATMFKEIIPSTTYLVILRKG
jgi:hypothetical protein